MIPYYYVVRKLARLHFSLTYQSPTQNRVISSITLDVDRLDRAENAKPDPNAICITFRRPQVSAIKPQKCEVSTTPKKATALIMPCSVLLMFSSHLAAGSTKAMLRPSMMTANRDVPLTSNRSMWNRPEPRKCGHVIYVCVPKKILYLFSIQPPRSSRRSSRRWLHLCPIPISPEMISFSIDNNSLLHCRCTRILIHHQQLRGKQLRENPAALPIQVS